MPRKFSIPFACDEIFQSDFRAKMRTLCFYGVSNTDNAASKRLENNIIA